QERPADVPGERADAEAEHPGQPLAPPGRTVPGAHLARLRDLRLHAPRLTQASAAASLASPAGRWPRHVDRPPAAIAPATIPDGSRPRPARDGRRPRTRQSLRARRPRARRAAP